MRTRSTLAALATLAILASPVFAAGPFAQIDTGATSIDFRPAAAGIHMTLTVSGPEGYSFQKTFGAGETASFSAFDAAGNFVPAGNYNWELRAAPELSDAQRAELADVRAAGGDSSHLKAGKIAGFEPMTGAFAVDQGAIVAGGETEATARPSGGNRLAEKVQVIATDLIVQGSECVGIDCTSSENFGFDTIRLKENNLRIKFQDTSVGTFPSTDWQLVANDSSSGGANRFSIEDITGGKTPFTIEGGSSSDTLYVDSAKRVGINTSTPVLQLHVVDGNTPGLRLEQNGSSGFTAQTWDLAGNEANFFVRDVTNGSELPFRIEPGADDNSIYIDSTNFVGVGTPSPDSNLNVIQTNGDHGFHLERAGNPVTMLFEDTTAAKSWEFKINAAGDFAINDPSASGGEFSLTSTGNLTLKGSLTTGMGNSCDGGCDRVFSSEYVVPSIEEHAAEMWSNSFLPAVGPTPEDQPVNLTDKVGGMLNELEKAHIYIEQLHAEKQDLAERLARIEALLDVQN